MGNESKEDCEHLAPSGSYSSSENEQDVKFVKKKQKKYLNRREYDKQMKAADGIRGRVPFLYLLLFTVVLSQVFTWIQVINQSKISATMSNRTNRIFVDHEHISNEFHEFRAKTSELISNQSIIGSKINDMSVRLKSLSHSFNDVRAAQSVMEKRMNATPELVALPETLHSLMGSIASMGSQMEDFNTTINKVSDELGGVAGQIDKLLNNRMNSNEQNTSSPRNRVTQDDILRQVKANLTAINETLWSHIKAMSDDVRSLHAAVGKLANDFGHYFSTTTKRIEANFSVNPFGFNNLFDWFPQRFNVTEDSTTSRKSGSTVAFINKINKTSITDQRRTTVS